MEFLVRSSLLFHVRRVLVERTRIGFLDRVRFAAHKALHAKAQVEGRDMLVILILDLQRFGD